MILKEQKKCAVVLLITGTVMFLTTWLTEDSHGSDFLNGLGCGLFFAGVLRLLRIYRIGRDSQKAADYDIYVKDESTAYIASRARNLTFFICIYGQLIAGIGVILFLKQKNTLFAEWASIFAIFHLLLVLQSLLLVEKNAKNGGEFYECVRSSEFIKVI